MSHRDRILPAAAGIAVLLVAVVVVLLLRSAQNEGVRALEDAKVAQVRTTATSFDNRVKSSIETLGGVGELPWTLTPGDPSDKATLESYSIDPDAESGIFLLDSRDRIVNGTLLRPGRLGSTYDSPSWEEAKAKLRQSPAAVLRVSPEGVTTELPSYAFAVAVRGTTPTSLRGVVVFEIALTEDSAFSQEIQGLADDGANTENWRFLDDQGQVVATTTGTGLGAPARDPRLATLSQGAHMLGDEFVVSADVPTVGWRVVFSQDREEFTAPLAGPLQSVGLILVLVLLAVGLLLTYVLARRLRQAREERRRLVELNRSQEEFISVVSHELRTPVAGVLGFLQTSLDHWETMDEQQRYNAVRRAFTNARRLQAMTRDVLDTESIESGHFGYVRHELDLGDEVRTAVDAFSTDAAGEVRVTVPDEPVLVQADADRIQQVLSNLLDNARKSSPADTPVEVALTVDHGTARITVEDQGSGIDPDELDRIFDKFVRGRGGSVSGTGLGLYISRRIVEAHDGRIWAESAPGDNTRFVVELPAVAAPARRIPAS